jgi:hypothetical protein
LEAEMSVWKIIYLIVALMATAMYLAIMTGLYVPSLDSIAYAAFGSMAMLSWIIYGWEK